MSSSPRVFLSYSHEDRPTAERLASSLQAGGVEVWFDKWEILPGDSLVHKIFEEGLSRADAFVVLISRHSVDSKWLQQELDAAMVRRMEGVTRIVPVRLDDVALPMQLRSLIWIDLTRGFDEAIRELQKAIFEIHGRPPVGQPPEFVKAELSTVPGLSRLGTALGLFLLKAGRAESGFEESYSEAKLAESLNLTSEEADDAVEELEALGLVEVRNYLGTAPYSHGDVEPTYALFLHFRDHGLDYDPEEDIMAVASAVAAQKEADGQRIAELVRLSPIRINRAASYLEDYGLIRVLRTFGTAPFAFNALYATGATRRFVAENAR
jgi:hypothetical protein